MRKVEFNKELSKIHVDDIQVNHLILVKKRGNEFGMIASDGVQWICKTTNNNVARKDISDACKWFGVDCEFYVLD